MADHKLTRADLTYKPFLVQAKKIGSQIIHEEISPPQPDDDESGIDSLLAGVDAHDIEEGRKRLAAENPQYASQHMNDYLDEVAGSVNFTEDEIKQDAVREAAVVRIGKLLDNESNETISFRRINANSQVELTAEDGEVIDTLAAYEFDELVESGMFTIL